jgi:CheY-like chemotaxis protein/HPt (histidine-containing phosphotransfer) domain-containing protein
VVELFDTVSRFVRERASSAGLTLSIDLPAGIPAVKADRRALRQVLLNLLSNSVKFTPAGGHIALEAIRDPSGGIGFRVRDTGIGIAAGDIPRALEPFGLIDSSLSRKFGGTGLGLAICKRLTELMGGKIWVESDAGKGATFHFTLLARASAAHSPPPWQLPQPQLAGKRLLIVEDNFTNQRIVSQRAQQWGLGVVASSSSEEALRALAEQGPFHAAILDLQLPDMDGLALAEEIRGHSYGEQLPLMLLSSIRLRSDDARPVHAGVSVFIYKPIRPAQLLDSLCRAMSVNLQREKRAPAAPSLDSELARRLPLRLLLADDNPINQKVGLSVLNKLGYRADIAQNGIEVLKALDQKAYDIIFLDIQMPEMDGLEAARKICEKWPAEKRPRIVAMTGNALMGDREKCLQAGMDDYISKPVRVADLQAALERWGEGRARKPDTSFFARVKPLTADQLLDMSIIAELREMPPENGVSMLSELITLFLEGAPQRIKQINETVHEPDLLAFHAHALKSMSLNMGAKRIVEITRKLEELGRNSNLAEAPQLAKELESAFHQTRAQLLALQK